MKFNQNIPTEGFNFEEEAPALTKIGDKSPFSVPDGYFENLTRSIQQKTIYSAQSEEVNTSFRFLNRSFYYAAAAVVVILIGLSVVYLTINQKSPTEITGKNLSNPNKKSDDIAQIKASNSDAIKPEDSTNQQLTTIKNKPGNPDQSNFSEKSLIVERRINNHQPEKNNRKPPSNPLFEDSKEGIKSEKSAPVYVLGNNENSINSNTGVSDISKVTNPGNVNEITKLSRKLPVDLGNDTCSETPILLIAGNYSKGYLFHWSTDENTSTIKVAETGTYRVTVTDSEHSDVFGTDEINVKVIPAPKINLDNVINICSNEPITLYPVNSDIPNPDLKFKWSPVDYSGSFLTLNDLGSGIYDYQVVISGCKNYVADFHIFVNDCNLEIPNVFTPNGDGFNDVFLIKGLENYPESELLVYDRNGNLVYENKDYKNDWSGGNTPDGVYYFILKLSDNQHTIRKGTVTLYRLKN